MHSIIKYFRQPYPCPEKPWKTIVAISLLVFALLFVLQPFGLNRLDPGLKLWVTLGYGAVTALAMCVEMYLFPLLLPKLYDENRWTVGRNILSTIFVLLLVTLGNIAFGYFTGITWQHFDLSVLLSALFITMAIAIFPIILLTVIRQNSLLAISLRETKQMNDTLTVNDQNNPKKEDADRLLVLSGTGKDDTLEINTNQLLFLEACGNYVKVNYLKNDMAVTQKMLRATIKQMEDATSMYPYIVKCHRAFLVNLEAVKRVDGNSQGYRLTLTGTEEKVPVSRAFTSTVKSIIK